MRNPSTSAETPQAIVQAAVKARAAFVVTATAAIATAVVMAAAAAVLNPVPIRTE